jgi:HD-like signal output (HDOD) protein
VDGNRSLVDFIREKLASNTMEVPVFHAVAFKLQQVLAAPDFSIDAVTQLIMSDSRLTSQVLRISNAAYYSGLPKVATIREAAIRLGAREMATMAMTASQQELYRSADSRINRTMKSLWEHALCTAIGSRWLAGKTGCASIAQESFLAGLLHDIGKLYILKMLEEITRSGEFGSAVSLEQIIDTLNVMHVVQGTFLMKKWNLPEVYCDVVRDHHLEQWHTDNYLLAIVRLVNHTCNRLGIGVDPDILHHVPVITETGLLKAGETVMRELEVTIKDTAHVVHAIAMGGKSSL